MYELGTITGGLVPTFLIRGLILMLMPKSSAEAPILRCLVANLVSGLIVIPLFAYGSANGGEPHWGPAALLLVSQGVWFLVDLVRWESKSLAQTLPTSNNEPKKPSPLSATPEASRGELLFWESMKNSTLASDYEAYLLQFPSGLFASLARSRLSALGSGARET